MERLQRLRRARGHGDIRHPGFEPSGLGAVLCTRCFVLSAQCRGFLVKLNPLLLLSQSSLGTIASARLDANRKIIGKCGQETTLVACFCLQLTSFPTTYGLTLTGCCLNLGTLGTLLHIALCLVLQCSLRNIMTKW